MMLARNKGAMTSRLFKAIVQVGAALGTAACAGRHEPVGPVQAPTIANADLASPATAGRTATLNAPAITLFTAFCDAPWPTTKGSNHNRPACTDPQNLCSQAAATRHECVPSLGPRQCAVDNYGKQTWDFCFNERWQCAAGTVRLSECKCLGPTPPGMECTDDGFRTATHIHP